MTATLKRTARPSLTTLGAYLRTDRFVLTTHSRPVKRQGREETDTYRTILDTKLNRPVEIYGQWEWGAESGVVACNRRILFSSHVLVDAAFSPLRRTFTCYCTECGASWISRYTHEEQCECPKRSDLMNKQQLRDFALVGIAEAERKMDAGQLRYFNPSRLDLGTGSYKRTKSRVETLIRRGLLEGSYHDAKLTEDGWDRVRELVAIWRTNGHSHAGGLGTPASR